MVLEASAALNANSDHPLEIHKAELRKDSGIPALCGIAGFPTRDPKWADWHGEHPFIYTDRGLVKANDEGQRRYCGSLLVVHLPLVP